MKRIITWSLLILLLAGCKDRQLSKRTVRVAFYNVENLFDTIDDPNKPDEEFTPEGRNKWTPERYDAKLGKLAQVVEGLEFPALLGLCEVENEQVCKDLAATKALRKQGYQVVHHESPDYRGIDNALLYRARDFRVLSHEAIGITFPKEIVENYTTRDILYVRGVLHKLDTLHLFVNHWPSRRGGLEASEPKRTYVAGQLRQAVDRVFSQNARAKVIIMGDFNDETDNRSVAEVLRAASDSSDPQPGELYNTHASLDAVGVGTYNYRGNWNLLDQVIVSGGLAKATGGFELVSSGVFKRDWMLFKHDKYGETPNRTYGGPNYYGGYSDHLPVYIELER